MRRRGGIIGASSAPATTSAGGIWTLSEAELYKRDIALGVTYGSGGDSYFSNVQLLLRMDGDGAAFVDSSGTPKTITAVGAATQSAVQSKWGGKSLALNGSNANLSLPSASFSLAGDFVIEAWVYLNSVSAYAALVETRASPGTYANFICGVYNIGGQRRLDFVTVGGAGVRLTGSSTTVPLNAWTHIAFVRSSGVLSAYVNGTRDAAQVSYATAITPASATMLIGRNVDGNFADGYYDDLRITVGSARGYTGATIPLPTAAFPAISGGVLGWPSLPNPPTGVSGGGGNEAVSLTWTAPAQNGGSAITDYVIQYSSDAGSTWTTFSRAASTITSAVQVTGLTNGTAYVFRVAAVTAVGVGGYSATSASVTPAGSIISLAYTAGSWNGSGTTVAPFTSSSVFGPTNNAALPFSFTATADADVTFSVLQYNATDSDGHSKQNLYYRVNGANYDYEDRPGGSTATQGTTVRLFTGEVFTMYTTGESYGQSPTDLYTNINMSAVAAVSSKLKLLNAPFAITGTGTAADPFVAPTPLTPTTFPNTGNPAQTIHFYAMTAGTLYISATLGNSDDDSSNDVYFRWRVLGNSYAGGQFLSENTTQTKSAAIPRGAFVRVESGNNPSITNLRFWAV